MTVCQHGREDQHPIHAKPNPTEARSNETCIAWKLVLAKLMLFFMVSAFAMEPPQTEDEPPLVRALLEQAWSAEFEVQDIRLALVLYCHAGLSGSAEGYYRIGRIYINGSSDLLDQEKARGYFALAAQLGHERAATFLDNPQTVLPLINDCAGFERDANGHRFDLVRYVASLPDYKQLVAELIRSEARKQHIPVPLALAIACAESNLDARAVSPMNAQGVMQLIPETQQRFGVKKPFDTQQNVRGGLRYLKWLLARFDGNIPHAVAAYNAGEGMVDRYRGIPPFAETQAYVKRVMFYAGLNDGTVRYFTPK
jgi:hypothetical protein